MYGGLVRGALAPAEAERVEAELLRVLSSYRSRPLVDVAGANLSPAGDERDRARVRTLFERGVEALLDLHYAPAEGAFEQAIALFEARLLASSDHALLHEASLALAESLAQRGRRAAAEAALARWLARGPEVKVTADTHQPAFVALVRAAEAGLGEPGALTVDADRPGGIAIVDGREVGPTPAKVAGLPPGRHAVAVRWRDRVWSEAAMVASRRVTDLRARTDTPGDRARLALTEALTRRRAAAEVERHAAKILGIRRADQLVVAVGTTRDGRRGLGLAWFGEGGAARSVGETVLGADDELGGAIGRLVALELVDQRRGGFVVGPSGAVADDTVPRRLLGPRQSP